MAIRFDEYEPTAGRIDLAEGTNAHAILSFLAEDPELGYAPKEIHEATGVRRGSVGSTLSRLEAHGLVRHKGDYWAIAADDRLGVLAAMGLSMDAFDDRPDRYAEDDGWADGLPDLDDDERENDASEA